jgi:hypothetical protein
VLRRTSTPDLVWTRAALAPGERWTLTVRMRLPAGAQGRIVNRVRVVAGNAVSVQSQDPTRVRRSTAVPVTG